MMRIPTRYKPGLVAEGRVVRVEHYGAFLEFEPDVIGLLLVPESLAGAGETTKDVLTVGETIRVQVLHIDDTRARMSVSQKALFSPTADA